MKWIVVFGLGIFLSAQETKQEVMTMAKTNPKSLSESQWESILTPEQFQICRKKGTERAFTGAFWNNKETGTYLCVACGQALFGSDTKYDSGSGWPSFYEPIQEETVAEHRDTSHGMVRTEVTCSRCDSHLGHVFSDGPKPTGLRYCINSASLTFKAQEK